MKLHFRKFRALWVTIAICSAVALASPFFVSAPHQLAVADLGKTRQEQDKLQLWFALYEEAMALRGMLDDHKLQAELDRLTAFSETTAAQGEFEEWIKKTRPGTLEALREDMRGDKLYKRYSSALVATYTARQRQTDLADAEQDLPRLIQSIRRTIVGNDEGSDALETASSELEDLRSKIAGNAADTSRLQGQVDLRIRDEFQRLR